MPLSTIYETTKDLINIWSLMDWSSKPEYQGVTKRRRLFWLTNSVLVCEPKRGGRGRELPVLANEYSCTQEPK